MDKILIVGIVGSGKTTFSREVSSVLGYKLFELDQVAHTDSIKGRPKRTSEEQMRLIYDIDSNNSEWIFEGVYRESQREIYELADTIIYLNLPMWIRKKRIVIRFVKQQLGIELCHYKSDLRMLKLMFKWTRDFEESRADYEKFLRSYGSKVIELKSSKEVDRFLHTLRSSGASVNHVV